MYLIYLGKCEMTSIEIVISTNQPSRYITCSGSWGIEFKVKADYEVLFDESNKS